MAGLSGRTRTLLTTVIIVVAAGALVVLSLGALPDVTRSRLPGAAGGSDTYPVQARFRDALDLVPNSSVRLADVPVGRVSSIEVEQDGDRYVAVAHLEIDEAYELPDRTVATIRSTSLLGEKYVALVAPDAGESTLRESGVIPVSRTTQDVEVEQLLASIGALLNGGGLQQLSTITREFEAGLSGRETDVKALLGDLDAIVNGLDAGRPALVAALESTQRLSTALAAQHEVLAQAVRDLDPATGVLARQQRQLTRALRRLQRLGDRATGLIRRATDATVTDLEALAPVLREVGKVAHLIPENVTLLVTYPFADTSVPAFSGAYGAVKGSVAINLQQLLLAVTPVADDSGEPFTPTAGEAGEDPAGVLVAETPAPPLVGVVDIVGDLLTLLLPRDGGEGR
ncbi:MCE family protein [Nocardioides caeni]|uniref:MCE family protein n=1 Tax=Nocardioides caeni TaxID=574700 RepID=A0A4S8MZD9_9ACTN|nr:MCE family protein [Nocardioides caeni]THV08838.1 MCE family protein [Nocardioides caeni]